VTTLKQVDHRAITRKVAERLTIGANRELFVISSGEHPDIVREDYTGHHSIGNLKNLFSNIDEARTEFLKNGASRRFQSSLGYACHYIEDLMAITTADNTLRGHLLELHNQIEPKISGYSNQIASEGIEPLALHGRAAIQSFVKQQVQQVLEQPDRALVQTEYSLEVCFLTCLSVAIAVCRDDTGFALGDEVNSLIAALERDSNQLALTTNAMFEKCERYIVQAKYRIDLERKLFASNRRSLLPYVFSVLSFGKARLNAKLRKIFRNCARAVTRELGLSQTAVGNLRQSISANINRLHIVLMGAYGSEFELRNRERGWYLFDPTNYKSESEARKSLDKYRGESARLQARYDQIRLRITKY